MTFDPNTGGRLATPIESFHAHITGSGFNQPAASIITSPGINGAGDLQNSLNNIQTFINNANTNGVGYTAVPNTIYDSYFNASGGFFFNSATPSLDSFLNPIFAAIIAGSGLAPAYERLRFGGIVLIPSGTYYVQNSITVPPGITIIGEGYGTKIVNATRLNLNSLPPTINSSAAPKPVFIIAADPNRNTNDAAIDPNNKFMFGRATQFIGLTICDNFVEPTVLGDTTYKLPQNTGANSTPNVGLIQQNQGSNLVLQNVNFLGRVTFSSGKVVSSATQYAVSLDQSIINITGTYLKIHNCFLDGFSQPVRFLSKGGSLDHLEIIASKIRSHGYLSGDNGSSGGNHTENNCMVAMNDGNARIMDNHFYGNHQFCYTIATILGTLASTPALDSISKISIANNTLLIDIGDSVSITPVVVYMDSTITAIDSYALVLTYGNAYDKNFGFELAFGIGSNNTTSLNVNPSSVIVTASGGLTISDSFPLIFGPAPASSGKIRLENTDSIMVRNAANSSDLVALKTDNNNYLYLGVDTDLSSHAFTTVNIFGQSELNLGAIAGGVQLILFGSLVRLNSGSLQFGSSAASTGAIQLQNAQGIFARNFGGTADISVIGTTAANNVVVGDSINTHNAEMVASNQVLLLAGSNEITLGSSGYPTAAIGSNTLQIGTISLSLASNASTTSSLATPTNLTFPVAANENWFFELKGQLQDNGTGGMKFAIYVPSGATLNAMIWGNTSASNGAFVVEQLGASSLTSHSFGAGNSISGVVNIYGQVINGATPGSLTVRIASTNGTDNIILLAGSTLIARSSVNV